ncbi:MAG: GNAT family N-acetyltransferase [Anaerolineaceae bacterium]
MEFTIRAMTIADYDSVFQIWQQTENIGLSQADSPERIAAYLERNPGLSFIAVQDEKIVGAILSGHDSRRGFIHHLAILPEYRRQGIGESLVSHCLEGLKNIGIDRCHIFVYQANKSGIRFWEKQGWFRRDELLPMSYNLPD